MNMNANERSQDTQALLVRQRQNQLRGSFDLADFVARHGHFSARSRILDLGAGTGQPMLARWKEIDPAQYYAFDYSESSLRQLEEDAARLGVRAATRCGDMDQLLDPAFAPELHELSHVLAVYSLYYSKDARALLAALRPRLRADGAVVIVGPAPANNGEWFQLLTDAGMALPEKLLSVSERFFPELIEPFGAANFRSVECYDAENPVKFSKAELNEYWRSNTYFDARLDEDVKATIEKRFRDHSEFVITKRIRLVRFDSPRVTS